ncbi:hypothetical protein [Mesobacillus stamsii]|uniref:Transposase n=1 Tax=Mesobacillus stamsii TaxID=225347 RepID=A0ABU0FW96_9BACI|nr:hypothetical protein [Mesobacillus stamsii]MDQ0414202.1 hypothetical protein [Mesobacillus stamsii]
MIEPGVTIPIKKIQNMNYEHHRPQISQTVIDTFRRLIDDQDVKGIAKYGKAIDEALDSEYDWLMMALEESVDLAKYLTKEIVKLRKENDDLEYEVNLQKSWIALLEARLNRYAKGL